MAGWSPLNRRPYDAALLLACVCLSACAGQSPFAPPAPPPEPIRAVTIDVPLPVVTYTPIPEAPVHTPPVIVKPAPGEVAIVLSSRQPAYEDVANELSARLAEHTVFDLGDKSEPPVSAFRRIQDSNTSAVVAIGLRAAISATAMAGVPVVFCQVFNVEANELLSDNSRGIAPLPPLDLQIAAWKQIDPELKRIGAIVGPGHEALVAEARLAAETHGVELVINIATSDRETLYLFNRMVRELDGFWLFPDNRVLSNTVLEKILADAVRQHVQVAVFNDALLELGAALSATTSNENIAATIVSVLESIAASGIESVPAMSPLTDVNVVTNVPVMDKVRRAASTGSRQTTLVAEQ